MTATTRLSLDDAEQGRIARITLENPSKLNALTPEMLESLVRLCAEIGPDETLRAVVLTGAGDRAFSGGMHLEALAAPSRGASPSPGAARTLITLLHDACRAVRALPVPVIARINGPCLGGALELAASCDLRIAAETALFAMPEVRLGIPSVIEAALLPRLVGWGKAREMVYLGRSYAAAEAMTMGLVERVVPLEDLDQAVGEWLADILAAGPQAIRLQKELIGLWEALPPSEAIRAGVDFFARAFESDEPARLLGAALEERELRRRNRPVAR
jgi:enoyl-CoA hydratase/carnithine racemase